MATQVKIFAGYSLTPERKNLLKHSQLKAKELGLELITHGEREYLGLYFSSPTPTFTELKQIEKSIDRLLGEHLPEFSLKKEQFMIFPQLFLF